jgi:hypothetical protein
MEKEHGGNENTKEERSREHQDNKELSFAVVHSANPSRFYDLHDNH